MKIHDKCPKYMAPATPKHHIIAVVLLTACVVLFVLALSMALAPSARAVTYPAPNDVIETDCYTVFLENKPMAKVRF